MPGSAANAIVDNVSYAMFSSLPVCAQGKMGNRARASDRRFQRAKIDASLAELKGKND